VIKFGLAVSLILITPRLVVGQYQYPTIDGCRIIEELVLDVTCGNLDIKTLQKCFDSAHEIELGLEFEWCKLNNISEADCQTEIQNYLGDSSLTLIRISEELIEYKLTNLQRCKLVHDHWRTSIYLVDLNQRSYIIQIDKKFKAIFDMISQDTISLFSNSKDLMLRNSELIRRYLGDN
jgi:hypothetical protein